MKKYIFIIIALALMACEKTIFVGGTVTDYLTGDSIEGIEMGLYRFKPDFNYDDKKWSDMELIATTITNKEGFFSFEILSGCFALLCAVSPSTSLKFLLQISHFIFSAM